MFKINIKNFILLFAITQIGYGNAQISGKGACPTNIQVMENFDLKQYLGIWFEQFKFPYFAELGGKCITANYTLNDNGEVNVINTQINKYTGIINFISGYATITDGAKLKVTFPFGRNATSNYWILDTDYNTYTVVYSCYEAKPDTHSTTTWILTRERKPAEETILKARNILESNNIDTAQLEETDQNDCGN
ncbi:apolipoprotein D-like [Teleopsis dalmanni]|uniref:apolipoprotein D-like n=1 Tax=Teleopsis dalmanni TaxID=139649 RepID=UPI0018CF23FD|nr:apolipoprotein D-like [Teleopsis dalmanni]